MPSYGEPRTITKNNLMYKHFFKRFIDVVLSLIAIIILSPLFIVLIVWLHFANEGAGVFFMQERPGYKGRIFKVIKFKTMNDKRDDEGKLLPDVQRITAIGRFLRNTSLDEVPQLFNVFKGDMALIGPRPLLVKYLPLYSKEQMRRHDVRPGITGWAQCHGRNAMTWKHKFELDVWYVDHLSFKVDLEVIWLTIRSVLKHEGINTEDLTSKVTMEEFNGRN